MTKDIEGWGSPEQLGLRLETSDRALTARRGGVVALILGVGMGALGAISWSGRWAFLGAFDSPQGRLGAVLCGAGGLAGLILSRTESCRKPRR